MNVVVVESPAKAKTINKYLGTDYTVLASYGHVRDLPSKNGSVNPDEDFTMIWDMDTKSRQRVNDIAKALKDADKLILATDPDREGEAISWHVLDILKEKGALKDKDVARVVFNAITKSAVTEAMENARDLDEDLVEAYLARRALDYLVGFTLSPVLWRKLPGSRSAGRVQSVALRLVCERELEIEAFKSQEYWTIEADLRTAEDKAFRARLNAVDGKKLGKFDVPAEQAAKAIESAMKEGRYAVDSVEAKPAKRNPAAPFTTSTLQQEASRKLGFSSARTMQIAQKLYEGINLDGETTGLITYMRTDGVQIANEAIAEARNVIQDDFGEPYVPSAPRVYKTKAKNAQEAHEAIRPTSLARRPKEVSRVLDDEQFKLYELIWKRTLASQMESADFERTTADIVTEGTDAKRYTLRATGQVVVFDGFLKLYQEGRDDDGDDEDGRRLPKMSKGETVGLVKLEPLQHFTEPPPRFTEATLIKRMEELGIGRPSTYTAILTTLRNREYVRMDKKRLIPEDKGRLVTAFLESFFERYVQYDFTANLEEQLDRISAGDLDWKKVLQDFWGDFNRAIGETADLRITEVLDALNDLLGPHVFPQNEDGSDPRGCPNCEGGKLSLKVGKFGAFVGCSNYPECRFTRQFTQDTGEDASKKAAMTTTGIELGIDPESGFPVLLKQGRFGPFIELGGKKEEEAKPKRASIPRRIPTDEVDFELALKLLSLPRLVGQHPESGMDITAGLGRYGPFVLHDGTYANIESFEDLFTIGLNRSVSLIAEKAAKSGGKSGTIKELGEHPSEGGPVNVMSGRYGPYVKHKRTNSTLPKGTEPEEVTLEQAVELIAAKAGKTGKAKKAPAKKKTAAKKKTKSKAEAEETA
ncbi:MAG: type I DNA topoisomerase [Alphaproteobacteria bacterium]|nr:type I DNA topoisomerase [Alphaproteobacteria bacterium]